LPCDVSQLERGAICLALYPYTLGFPAEQVLREAEEELTAKLRDVGAIEQLEATIRRKEPPAELLVKFKLRRVLILHDGRNPGIQDVAVARINSITEEKRSRAGWYSKLDSRTHRTALLIGRDVRHGSNGMEEYVDCTSVTCIRKDTILRRVGLLDPSEMAEVSGRLITVLELDIPSDDA
jgi:hypothetical protein